MRSHALAFPWAAGNTLRVTAAHGSSSEMAAPLSPDELALIASSAADLRDLARRLRSGDVTVDEARFSYERMHTAYLVLPLLQRLP
jgi:hypothetical protein